MAIKQIEDKIFDKKEKELKTIKKLLRDKDSEMDNLQNSFNLASKKLNFLRQ